MANVPCRYRFDRRAAVSIVFATAVIPVSMGVGLAIDYSFYAQAQAQLNLAADIGAMHAVRIASSDFIGGMSAASAAAAGSVAGQQWFNAQLGTLSTANATANIPPVQFNASTSTFTSTVNYTATMTPHFAGLFNVPSWGMAGTSSAVLTTNSYVEIGMLIDNSSSMLIGATPTDINKIEALTICAPTATARAAAQDMTAYSWNYPSNQYGYGFYQKNAGTTVWYDQSIPLKSPVLGNCDPNFTGGALQCPYPPSFNVIDANGYCPPGTGIPDSGLPKSASVNPAVPPRTDNLNGGAAANIPQAPCGFACHTGNGTNDYYTLVRTAQQTDPTFKLRFDVIQAASQQVIQTLQSKEQVANQFSLGVFEFNSAVTQVHPTPGGGFVEADNNLTQAASDVASIQTPVVPDQPNTDFPDAMAYLAANVTAAGDGSTPATPRKNLFIITDGLEDYSPASRTIGPMTNAADETVCASLKAKGFSIYVLYTPYYPLPNPFYLNQGTRSYVEPTVPPAASNPVIAALQACASNPTYYYQASSSADINTALQAMLLSALNSPGRLVY